MLQNRSPFSWQMAYSAQAQSSQSPHISLEALGHGPRPMKQADHQQILF